MHEPQLAQFCVSLLKPQKNFRVLDLRLRNPESIEKYEMEKILCTLPLVISCSIKVLNPDDNFKPEYIIPQMVMLVLVENQYTVEGEKVIGCIYTSTQRNDSFKWKDISKLDNMALPARNATKKKGLCPELSSIFKVSDSINYEYEMLKNTFKTTYPAVEGKTLYIDKEDEALYYENSIFGQLEKRLDKKDLKNIK